MFSLGILGCLVALRSTEAILSLPSLGLNAHEEGIYGLLVSSPLIQCPISRDESKNVSEVNVYWYGPGDKTGCKYRIHEAAEKIIAEPNFIIDRDLIVVCPGFKTPHEDFAPPFCSAFEDLVSTNVIFLDHFSYTHSSFVELASYKKTANYMHSIAKAVADFIVRLIAAGLQLKKVRLVGHSYGAQSIGVIAAKITEITKQKMPHCTGLDPCGPIYNMAPLDHKLDKSDCEYVECYHSNVGQMGTTNTICHANFYPNGNFSTQPGCGGDGNVLKKLNPDMGCSHMRAIALWLESVKKPENFLACECSRWEDFQDGKCSEGKKVIAGFHTTNDVEGIFIFRTDDKPDYGLGREGAEPAEKKQKSSKKLLGDGINLL